MLTISGWNSVNWLICGDITVDFYSWDLALVISCISLILIISLCPQFGGNMDGKLDEGAASLMLDTKPSKVVSNELTVSWIF